MITELAVRELREGLKKANTEEDYERVLGKVLKIMLFHDSEVKSVIKRYGGKSYLQTVIGFKFGIMNMALATGNLDIVVFNAVKNVLRNVNDSTNV